jgi:acyl carrier protein
MDQAAIENKVREFIDREVLEGQGADLTPETPLLELGILDSFSLFLLISFIAEEFKVKLELDKVGAEQFKNIATIASAVRQHASSSG